MTIREVDEILSKFIKEHKLTLTRPIDRDFKELNEKRNRIVHEGEIKDIDDKQVLEAFGKVMYLLYVLGEVALKYGISLIDEVGFMDDFREKLKAASV